MRRPAGFASAAPVAAWAMSAALVALAVGAVLLGGADALHLILPLAVAVTLTVLAVTVGARWLARTSVRARFVAVSAFASAIAFANLAVLDALMVKRGDAEMVAVLLVYAAGVAIGAGIAAGRASSAAVARISTAARRMAEGDLEARVGRTGGGRDLERLGAALDGMAIALADAQRRERAVESQRRDLIVSVSHDLRTPLADLQAMAEAIEDRVVSDQETVASYAGRMNASVSSLSRLVDDLFEFVQLEAEAIEAESERARVEDVVGWALDACNGQAALKGLELRTELGDVAEAPCSRRLTRVLQNLLQNAIRHTPSDGAVRITGSRDGGAIELAVEDSGDGLTPEAAECVFEPFWRGDAARAGEGSGLGLALAKRIVESLGGSIAVESAPQIGSRFAIRIPQPS